MNFNFKRWILVGTGAAALLLATGVLAGCHEYDRHDDRHYRHHRSSHYYDLGHDDHRHYRHDRHWRGHDRHHHRHDHRDRHRHHRHHDW